jgi:hypothetical protein
MQAGDGPEQQRGAIGHGHVHHLPLAGALRLEQPHTMPKASSIPPPP